MPIFDYKCMGCNEPFEAVLKISERKDPCDLPCPLCGEIKVEFQINKAPGLVASAYTNIKTPSGFKDVLNRMKAGNPRCTIDV